MNFLLKALSILVMTTMTSTLDNEELKISFKKNDKTQQDTIYLY